MSNRPKIEHLLKSQALAAELADLQNLLCYAECIAKIENVVAVVSDLKNNTSKIFPGKFGAVLGVESYQHEDSIWERHILNLMTDEEQEEKYLAELRFFHFLRHTPRSVRSDYYLASKLRVTTVKGVQMEILHRMYYVYSADSDSVCYALCLYGSLAFDFEGKSIVINSVTGVIEELTGQRDFSILSKREKQVLKLIEEGRTSAEIAEILSISKNTVSRHRQEILGKLQVKNSIEACRKARAMRLV